jgi:ubiquinol-cytochrome c reductase cytochrome c subunit
MGGGGVVVGAVAPALRDATPTQIAEAVRVGPYVMPAFGERLIGAHALDSIVAYVERVVKHPPDEGGWALGHVGPIPEGMVAWLLGLASLLIVARLLGERTP